VPRKLISAKFHHLLRAQGKKLGWPATHRCHHTNYRPLGTQPLNTDGFQTNESTTSQYSMAKFHSIPQSVQNERRNVKSRASNGNCPPRLQGHRSSWEGESTILTPQELVYRVQCQVYVTVMHLAHNMHPLRRVFPIPRHRNPFFPRRMSMGSQELSPFQQDLKTIDPEVLSDAMGDSNQPPEEPLLSTFEEGFGYHTAVAVGRSLGRYLFARKVRIPTSPSQPHLIVERSLAGQLALRSGSRCEFPPNLPKVDQPLASM
jgi:hypothetical protein